STCARAKPNKPHRQELAQGTQAIDVAAKQIVKPQLLFQRPKPLEPERGAQSKQPSPQPSPNPRVKSVKHSLNSLIIPPIPHTI
ncbi:MAG: hypothetical protein ACRC9P_05865, partial [Bacteroides sp.]